MSARPSKPARSADPPASRPSVPPGGSAVAGWSSPVARQAHNLKVAGSNPAPATNQLSLTTAPKHPLAGPLVRPQPRQRANTSSRKQASPAVPSRARRPRHCPCRTTLSPRQSARQTALARAMTRLHPRTGQQPGPATALNLIPPVTPLGADRQRCLPAPSRPPHAGMVAKPVQGSSTQARDPRELRAIVSRSREDAPGPW
jgi:hypothetical protein